MIFTLYSNSHHIINVVDKIYSEFFGKQKNRDSIIVDDVIVKLYNCLINILEI